MCSGRSQTPHRPGAVHIIPAVRLKKQNGFSLLELVCVVTILAILGSMVGSLLQSAKGRAEYIGSCHMLRGLIIANESYASFHQTYVPYRNDEGQFWYENEEFVEGYLDGKFPVCPIAKKLFSGKAVNGGGYGYNGPYVGSGPDVSKEGEMPINIERPGRTMMFTTSARAAGGDRYRPAASSNPIVHPYGRSTLKGVNPGEGSVHFRIAGRALVAWCDGSLSLELPSRLDSGGDVGWFGPEEENGFWNPNSHSGRYYRRGRAVDRCNIIEALREAVSHDCPDDTDRQSY